MHDTQYIKWTWLEIYLEVVQVVKMFEAQGIKGATEF
jgi:hypothetical protein